MAERRPSRVDQVRDWLEQHRAEVEGWPHGALIVDFSPHGDVTIRPSPVYRLPRGALDRLAGDG